MSRSPRRSAYAFGLAAILGVVLIPLSAPRASAVAAGTPGPIVYAQYGPGGGSQMLWTAMPGGETVPVPGTEGARAGRWSPDGRVICFSIWGKGIFLVNPDGSGLTQIFTPAAGQLFGEGIWSPDGQRIAFVVSSDGYQSIQIEITDALGEFSELLPTELMNVWDWLPDGTFLGSAWRGTTSNPYERNEEVAQMTPDGAMTYLTDTLDDLEGVPRISPDGTRITFLSSRWTNGNGIYSIGVMDRDGSHMHLRAIGTQVTWPAWSPSGTEIVIGPVPVAIKADLSGGRLLTAGGGSGDGLDWAPLAGTTTAPLVVDGIRAAVGRDPSARTSTGASAATIWPVRDGYRDTVKIRERMHEPAKATLDIYGPTGKRVRRVTFHFDTGWVVYTWNGRSSTGKMLAAGRYRLVTTSVDLAGNVHRVTLYVTLHTGHR